jgi:outer membrane protein assembly factor BamB
MNEQIEKTSESIEVISPWRKTAVATAVIGAIFSAIITTLLIANYFQSYVTNAKREKQWEALKVEIRSQPDNEQLISQIRRLDLQIRRCRIHGLDFSRKGGYLLLAAVTVLLIGVRWAGSLKKKIPSPQPLGDRLDEQMRKAMMARWAITVGLVVLGVGALFLILNPSIDFRKTAQADVSYPSDDQISKNWPRFRGPGGLGVSPYTNIPANWNGKTGEGVLWKSKVPLPGFNSPIVWGDLVFLSGADANEREVYCFDAFSGNLLWERPVTTSPQTGVKKPVKVTEGGAGFAAPTMVTDGRRVCAIFANGEVGCFDLQGKNIWTRNLGLPDSAYGYSSSLDLYRNLLLILYDQGAAEDQKSKLMALNVLSGATIWEAQRPVPNSWASPIVTRIGNQYQVITCGDPWVIAYDPANGAELWRAKCLGGEIASSPIYANGLVFAIEPYTKLVAIKPDGQGDVTKTHIAWTVEDSTPDICCPVSWGELLFLLTSEGKLTCYKVKDGTKVWDKDLKENFQASPSLVGNRLYLLSEKGIMFIVEAGMEYKQLAKCELGEDCNASPAFADGRIYIRGQENLYCIGEKNSKRQ